MVVAIPTTRNSARVFGLAWVAGPRTDSIQRTGRIRQRPQRQREQGQFQVIPRDAVGATGAAAGEAGAQDPCAGLADSDGDGLHGLAAGAAAVTGFFIQVAGPEAARAVVAVARAGGCGGDGGAGCRARAVMGKLPKRAGVCAAASLQVRMPCLPGRRVVVGDLGPRLLIARGLRLVVV